MGIEPTKLAHTKIIDDSVPRQPSSVRMQSVVLARGVAALFVVFHHAGRMAEQDRFFGAHAFGGVYGRFTGVNYFFVLSGFFIGLLSWKYIGSPGQAGKFFAKRMARIYPVYWLVFVPQVILYFAIPTAGLPRQRDPINIAFSFFLLPYWDQPVYGVAWTLVQEFLFCIVMALIIAIGRKGIWILPAWAALIIAGQFTGLSKTFPATILLHGANFQFLLGIATSRILRKYRPAKPFVWAIAGACMYISNIIFGGMLNFHPFFDQTIYGLSTCVLLVGLSGIEEKRPIKVPSFLLAFGAASYSTYLIHPVFLSFGTNIVSHFLKHAGIPVEAAVLLLIALAIYVAMLFDRYVEAPVTRIVSPTLARWLEKPFLSRRKAKQGLQIAT